MAADRDTNISKLILGTAQFGLNYGISNQRGQIPQSEVNTILTEASKAGILTLDTAAAYGESEKSLGEALKTIDSDFRIISKYPPNNPEKSVKQALEESLERLGIPKLYGYMLHNYSSYSSNQTILQHFQELKASGKVQKTGISLYHPHEAQELLEKGAAIDLVQFPFSVFDRRFDTLLPQLHQAGIETHVRSVYLQGLYFLQPSDLPEYFKPVAHKIERLQQLATAHNLPLGTLLLGFVLANPFVTNVVLGVESLQTLQENIAYCSTQISEIILTELQDFTEHNEAFLLPYKWPAS